MTRAKVVLTTARIQQQLTDSFSAGPSFDSASFLDSGLYRPNPLLGRCLHIPLPFLSILHIMGSFGGQRASSETNVEIFLF